jgi:hypothetical protein
VVGDVIAGDHLPSALSATPLLNKSRLIYTTEQFPLPIVTRRATQAFFLLENHQLTIIYPIGA